MKIVWAHDLREHTAINGSINGTQLINGFINNEYQTCVCVCIDYKYDDLRWIRIA